MSEAPALPDPVLPITEAMLSWASQLEVVDTEQYPLPGGSQQRHWDPDPRLVHLNRSTTRKNSDRVTYYEHVATIRHKKDGLVFICFRETMDALLAKQKDPAKFPAWLMAHPVKQTERGVFFAIVKHPPTANTADIYEWLTSLDDFGKALKCDVTWMYDVLSWYLIRRGVVQQDFYGSAPHV